MYLPLCFRSHFVKSHVGESCVALELHLSVLVLSLSFFPLPWIQRCRSAVSRQLQQLLLTRVSPTLDRSPALGRYDEYEAPKRSASAPRERTAKPRSPSRKGSNLTLALALTLTLSLTLKLTRTRTLTLILILTLTLSLYLTATLP